MARVVIACGGGGGDYVCVPRRVPANKRSLRRRAEMEGDVAAEEGSV